ncbi:MAG: nuclear transport factor 2 family protein, partial [Chitinophagaceae bacterium]
MKLTKKLEAEIKALMEDYWNSYFEGNLDHWAGYLVDNYRNIGGTEEEIWNSKQEIVDYTYRIIDQMQGVTELRNKQTQIIPYDPYIMVHELLDIYIKLEGQWTFYQKFRLSSLIQKTSEGWKVLHQHGSYPDSKTLKGEAFAFDEIKAENIKLIEAVKSRTIELEEKNRELEIESSLERVRTVAMGMKKPDDLLNICEVLFIELNKIGFKNMRCSLIHIFNDEQNYFDDYDYSDFTGGKISTIPFKGNAVVEDFLKRIRKSKDSFAEVVVKGKALEEFLSFRKKSGQIQDKRLLKAKEINYYFFSVGIGNIGISNFGKISHKQLLLLKRFRNVFHLAYQRYTDISLAEAQSKEAQIELGLERVRARAMAMQKSDELKELIATVSSELGKLDLVLDRCIIMTYDSKTLGSTWWMANPETPEQGIGLFVKYHEHSPYLAHLNAWRNRIGKWEYVLEGEVKKEWDKFLFVETELSLLPEFVIANMRAKERVYFSASFNNFGCLSIAALEPLTDQQIDIMLRFAKVFDLTYTRFNDLQKAEAQAKEAKIEAALERVRSRTMAMQKSDELLDVASVLFQQVKALGVPQWNCGFNIWDIGDKEFTYYPGSPDGIIFPSPCKIPLTEHPVFIRFDASRKRGDELLVYEKEGQEQKDHYQYMLSLPGVGDLLKSMLESGFQLPTFQIDHLANFAYGNLLFITYEHFPEMHDVFKRFARVFEQTYTRFLD